MRLSGQLNFPKTDHVFFGKPATETLRAEAERLGAKRVFLIVSRTLDQMTDEIENIRVALGEHYAGTYSGIPQHTTRREVVEAAAHAIDVGADLVVAVGGGSVVDAAKIVTLCIEHGVISPSGLDGFEVLPGPDGRPIRPEHRGRRIRQIAIPSTLSGGEYNAGCLVTDADRGVKHTFFHPLMAPISVILDPDLARHTPKQLWVGSGTRALDHGVEALCSKAGNPFVDGVVLHGVRLLSSGLRAWNRDPTAEARRLCQQGSWLSSVGLQMRVPMGASHGIGHVLGGTCQVPHFLCTPVLLPSILRYNEPESRDIQAQLADALGMPGASAADAFEALTRELGLPQRLSDVGVGPDQFEKIGQGSMKEFFVFSNPRPLRTPADVIEILKLAA